MHAIVEVHDRGQAAEKGDHDESGQHVHILSLERSPVFRQACMMWAAACFRGPTLPKRFRAVFAPASVSLEVCLP
jgi:hypothetical protein